MMQPTVSVAAGLLGISEGRAALNDGLPVCITQDPREPAGPQFREVCAKWATEIADSVYCPPECGGHPICKPCLALALECRLVRPLT